MSQSPLATAADYADALLTARRARSWIVGLLLVMLLIQIGTFLAIRFTTTPQPGVEAIDVEPTTQPASTQPASADSPLAKLPNPARQWMEYGTGLIDFLGIALVLILAVVLLLIVIIMLVGRLIGVAQVTGAFIWCLILAVLLFPWQAFLSDFHFKIPGVLYTWDELISRAHFGGDDWSVTLLGWARFVGWPVLAVIMLFVVHSKSRRGLKLALGEAEPSEPPAV